MISSDYPKSVETPQKTSPLQRNKSMQIRTILHTIRVLISNILQVEKEQYRYMPSPDF